MTATSAIELGEFASGFASWRRLLASAPTPEVRWKIFGNAVVEVATYVARGLDRTVAADALQEIAEAQGFGEDVDDIQTVIADAFANIKPAVVTPLRRDKENGHDKEPAPPLLPLFPFPIDEPSIIRRQWIIPGLFMRRQVTVLVAPSGSGKSLLTLQIGIDCAQETQSLGWKPRGKFKVLVINSEDDFDEIRRRLAATVYRMQVDQEEIRNNFAVIDGTKETIGAVIAKIDPRKKTAVTQPLFDQIIAIIKDNGFDLVFVDPFAETFEGDENSNSELKWAGMLWRKVARETNAAVCLIHHTKKYSSGMAGDVDAARGAGALIGIARVVSTLFPMTTKEAEAMGVSTDLRPYLLRYDDAKANLNMISPYARWFRKETIRLQNGDGEDMPGDDVGVLVPWKPKGPQVLERDINNLFVRLDQGILDDTGAPTGDYYTFEKRGANRGERNRYLPPFVQEFLSLDALVQAEELVAAWRKAKRLKQIKYLAKRARADRWRVVSELSPDFPRDKPVAENGEADEQQAFTL